MKTAGLVTSVVAKKQPEEIEKVICQLKKCGFDVIESEDYDRLFSKADMVVVLGGDGTILSVAEYSAKYDVPLLGFNFGHLGYLAELKKEQLADFEKIKNNEYKIEKRMMIDFKVVSESEAAYRSTALNDAVATNCYLTKIVQTLLEIDDNYTGD